MSAKARTPKNSRKPPTAPPSGLWDDFSPPEDFDEVASAEFARLRSSLEALGTLDRTDPRVVTQAAEHYATIARAKAELAAYGELTIQTSNGSFMPHPMLKTIAAYSSALRGLHNDLGLTPKSSKKAAAQPESPAADGWDGILNVAS